MCGKIVSFGRRYSLFSIDFSTLYLYSIQGYVGCNDHFEIDGALNENLPRTPVFQTMYVYLRPLTMCLETVKWNLILYLLPSLRVNRVALEVVAGNGIPRITSGRPGESTERLKICTSAPLLSASNNQSLNIMIHLNLTNISYLVRVKWLVIRPDLDSGFNSPNQKWIQHEFA